MIQNLRFEDGRSLHELVEQIKIEHKLQEEEERLKSLTKDEKAEESSATEANKTKEENASDKDSFMDYGEEDDSEKDEDRLNTAAAQNPMMYADLLKAREQQKKKREEFVTSLGDNLSDEQKEVMLKKYDEQMRDMERNLLKEQEDQADVLKNRLAARQKKLRSVAEEVNCETKEQSDEIKLI